jgi:hypothetical protein
VSAPTVSGLIDKCRELAGRIEHVQRELRALVADLDHIDAVIHIFDPEAVIGPAKRYPIAHQAFRGEMARHEAEAPTPWMKTLSVSLSGALPLL